MFKLFIALLPFMVSSVRFPNLKSLETIIQREELENMMHSAAYEGNVEAMKGLLKTPGVRPDFDDSRPLYLAAQSGRTDMVKLLLEDGRLNPQPSAHHDALEWAIFGGHTDTAKVLLNSGKVDPSLHDNTAIKTAARQGRSEIVDLLLNDGKVNPAASHNFAIINAVKQNHIDIVKMMLKDPRVIKEGNLGVTLRDAASNGNLEMTKLLLSSKEVNPAWDNYAALKTAVIKNNYDIVQLMLADDRVILQDLFSRGYEFTRNINYYNDLLVWGSETGNQKIVDFFLKKVSPDYLDNQAIKIAAKNGHFSIVKSLLADPRVDASANNNEAIKLAKQSADEASSRITNILKAPLDGSDSAVPLSDRHLFAIQLASKNEYEKIINLLRNNPKVKSKIFFGKK